MKGLDRATRTGGRPASLGYIAGAYGLSVGKPNSAPPEGWEWTLLTDVARLETGHTPSRKHPEWWGGGVPWIGIKDATSNHGQTIHTTNQYTNELGLANSAARLLPENTVCLSRTASVGYVVVMGIPMATSQDFVNWVCTDELNHEYLKYVLLSERDSFLRFASGTTHQTIYFPEVKAFHVCLPPRAEQDAIAHVLGTLDDKIELNRRMNETLEGMARALFKSWFVDFEPVRAKMDGRWKPGQSLPGLPAHLYDLFPNKLTPSDLGEIPEGWRLGRFDDLLLLQRGFDLPQKNRVNGPYQVIAASGPSTYHIEAKVSGPGVVTGRSGVLGKVFLVTDDYWPLNTTLWVKEFRLSKPIHAYFVMSNLDFELLNAGSAVPTLNRNHVHGLSVTLPDESVITEFENIAGLHFRRIKMGEEESRTLAALRDTLLPKLISGELRIKDAEKFVEDVA